MTDRDVILIATSFYVVAFLFGLVVLLMRRRYPRSVMLALLGSGFLMQTVGLNMRGAAIQACPLGNFFEIAQFIVWSLVLIFFIIGPTFKLKLLGFFTAALAALLSAGSLFPSLDSPYPPGIFGGNPWIELHAALAIFSYSVFAILALVSCMFLAQQHGLKAKQTKGIYQFLPSISQLDQMSQRLLVSGLIFLTLALAVGTLFWINNVDLVPVFKLSATVLVWAGYLAVAILRVQKKLVTRRHAIACIALFTAAILSLWPVDQARSEPPAEVSGLRQNLQC